MILSEQQQKFTRMVADLIIWAYGHGYALTLGEAYRSDEQSVINSLGQQGRELVALLVEKNFSELAFAIRNNGKSNGIKHSIHQERLAVDLNLFKDGVLLTSTEDHQPLGEYWESLGGSWGGRFRDGNHYSLEFNGIR